MVQKLLSRHGDTHIGSISLSGPVNRSSVNISDIWTKVASLLGALLLRLTALLGGVWRLTIGDYADSLSHLHLAEQVHEYSCCAVHRIRTGRCSRPRFHRLLTNESVTSNSTLHNSGDVAPLATPIACYEVNQE